ncbi:MAG TPA: ABC transporter permease [Sphaerochaeta sp.]|nr:ABC transporter permease [Sphaerochaeta sp.]HQB90721.1 ABC transporter permease [Sphaerochaeta sp.]
MHKYILRRVLLLIPIILGVSLLVFVMTDSAEGNVLQLIGDDYTPQQMAELMHEYGYDRSVLYRYGNYMKGLVRGNLGKSFIYKRPVLELYLQRLPATLKLAGASILVAIVLSIPLGIKAARSHGTLIDNGSMVLALLGLSMPNYWLGLMLAVLFSQKLHWFPSGGNLAGWKSLVLPAITLGTGLMATMTRTTRSSMLDVIRQDYLRTARAKGVPEKVVIRKHGLRNALIPIITIIGTELGKALGGAVVTENVFSYPGVGRLIIEAVNQRDTITVTGCLIMTAVLVAVIQLFVDILYAVVDPRLRAQYTTGRRKRGKKQQITTQGAVV